MTFLAKRMETVRPSATKAMTAAAAALRAEGRDVVTLSQGEPDFDTPAPVQLAGIAAITYGKTRYTAVQGVLPLREAIARKLARDHGLAYSPDDITVGCGAKQVLFNALFATIDPNDEVIIPAPCWVSYPEMVKLAGGRPVIIDCPAATGFKLTPKTLEAAITPATKWLMLNSPSNPTGAVYAREELAALGAVLERHPQIWVMSDDIYEKLIYDGRIFATMAEAAPTIASRCLIINGVSKAAAMTGWRVGYGAGPASLIKAMNVIQGQTVSHTSSISQYAAIEAIDGDQTYLQAFVAEYQARRDLVVALINQVQGLSADTPEGAFYIFASCEGVIGKRTPDGTLIDSDDAFALYLLRCAGVAVVAGSGFLASPYVRLSYASSREELTRACTLIAEACAALR